MSRALVLAAAVALLVGAAAAGPIGGALPQQASLGTSGRIEISAPFRDSRIVIGASARFAGAIDSLVWRGREFINRHDHGRLLQSASQFNGWHECFNPTEGGSRDDGGGNASSSRLLAVEAKPHRWIMRSRMAFWLSPGETSPACRGITAVNKQRLSDHELVRTVAIGVGGIANAIEHRVTFRVPADYDSAVFEALTAYLPAAFSRFWGYDPAEERLVPLSEGPGEQARPVIAATPDGRYALGVYSPGLPQRAWPRLGYGRFRFGSPGDGDEATVKWNCVFRERAVKAGDHRFTCYSIVGTLDDVAAAIGRLARLPKQQ
jgi:hypothetical protein